MYQGPWAGVIFLGDLGGPKVVTLGTVTDIKDVARHRDGSDVL